MSAPQGYQVSSSARLVAKELLHIECVQFNLEDPFIWVSGVKSPVYCDNRKINSFVSTRNIILDAFVKLISEEYPDVEVIAGVATGGIPMGVLIADKMNLPFIYVRQEPKKHGLMKQVEGDYQEGNKVVLIEDHVSTGGSSLKAINGLRKENLDLLGIISIMTYGFDSSINLFKENHIDHYSLCDLESILELAHDLGIITSSDKSKIQNFKKNPSSWLETA